MARSRKKAIIKHKCGYYQTYGHRALRRKVKIQISQENWEIFPILNEIMNKWNVSDWYFRIDPTDVRNKTWWVTENSKIVNGKVYIPK